MSRPDDEQPCTWNKPVSAQGMYDDDGREQNESFSASRFNMNNEIMIF